MVTVETLEDSEVRGALGGRSGTGTSRYTHPGSEGRVSLCPKFEKGRDR